LNSDVSKRSLRILVIDDNKDAANALTRLLRLIGHEVKAVYESQQALAVCIEMNPELVLLDLGMPGVSGYDVCRSIRGRPEFSDIRVVAITGFAQEESRRSSDEAGFDEHFVKPVRLEELERMLDGLAPSQQRV
jgi:CheY-like chemotaxis protein